MQPLQKMAPVLAGALLLWTAPLHAWLADVAPEMNSVLLERCTSCHDLERVGMALGQGRSLGEIQSAMLARGAVLNERDKQILGTFWGPASPSPGEPLPEPLAAPISADQAQAFHAVIEQRCVFCHTRERIDEAIARRLPYEPLEEMMLRRGATLNPREKQVLKIFWEAPHR